MLSSNHFTEKSTSKLLENICLQHVHVTPSLPSHANVDWNQRDAEIIEAEK